MLRQLAPDVTYRSLVALGIGSIHGLPVASFEKDNAERLLFFCSSQGRDAFTNDLVESGSPTWLRPPAPSRKRSHDGQCKEEKVTGPVNGVSSMTLFPGRQRL